jgi:hypothetical protein
MKQENACERLGFKHCWIDITPQEIYCTCPPKYPPKERQCANCGKKEVLKIIQHEKKEWQSVE